MTLLLPAALFAGGCDLLETDHHDSDYPTTIQALSPNQLENARAEFRDQHGGQVCTPLNRFGFTDWELTQCTNGDYYHPGDTIDQYPALVVEQAKHALKAYSEFTGVTDTTALKVERLNGSQVKFHHQRYDGLEVKRTQLIVDQNDDGVFAVGGNWYPNISIPAEDRVSIQEAQRSLIGQELTWHDIGGQPHTFQITDEAFPEKASATKVILPVESEDRIELHVAWQTEVYGGPSEEHPSWYIYVDTTTGEQLHSIQLFQT